MFVHHGLLYRSEVLSSLTRELCERAKGCCGTGRSGDLAAAALIGQRCLTHTVGNARAGASVEAYMGWKRARVKAGLRKDAGAARTRQT